MQVIIRVNRTLGDGTTVNFEAEADNFKDAIDMAAQLAGTFNIESNFSTGGKAAPAGSVKADAELEEAVTKVEETAKKEPTRMTAKQSAEQEARLQKERDAADKATDKDENLIDGDDKVLDYKADVVPALLALQKKTSGLKDLLTKFGVTKGDQLKAEQYADIVAQANKLAA